ncbi:MAG TPA: ABC transporter permease [Actinomycetota bacterium]|nr:ABC transporter permease [Actinomycetota bacterium]
MRVLLAAFRLQLGLTRGRPDDVLVLAMIPLFTVVFLSVVQAAGRPDLAGHAVMGPVLIALWGTSITIAGEIVVTDRGMGVLEGVIAAPARLPIVVVGRVIAVTVLGLIGYLEAWLVARFGFGLVIPIEHPVAFGATLLLTGMAMACTALLMAAVFVLGRSARPFQRALTYPFYVLGGVVAPVELLPGWVQPATRVVFLSWSSAMLRDSLAPGPIRDATTRLTMIALLGLAAFAGGWWLLRKTVDRVRLTGTMTYA